MEKGSGKRSNLLNFFLIRLEHINRENDKESKLFLRLGRIELSRPKNGERKRNEKIDLARKE